MKYPIFGIMFSFVLYLIACQKEEQPKYDSTAYILDYGTFPAPNLPADNALTKEKVLLGRMLFYEKKLSGNNTQACADCHLQAFAFSDTATFSLGIRGQRGKRQAMSIFNMAWHDNEFFWDGRAHLLRDQALKPIQDALEMDEKLENVITKLNASTAYKNQFYRAFESYEIDATKISLALEQFMMTIVSNNSKYDRYLAGKETLTAEEERGRALFFQEFNPFFPNKSGADCAHCHSGDNFENDQYMNNGLDTDAEMKDIGRENVTKLPEDKAKFKVPSLRNLALTAPYMHDGRFRTLEEVVDHYNQGLKPSSTLDGALEQNRPTGLQLSTTDKVALVSFLKTLTDTQLTTDKRYSSPF